MIRQRIAPLCIGLGMGLMMLRMLHEQMTAPDAGGLGAIAVFVAAHLFLGLIGLALPFWAATRLPRVRRVLARLHRPNLQHAALMLIGAAASGMSAHLWIHGGML